MSKAIALHLKDDSGRRVLWSLYRDCRKPSLWMLRDHAGYLRTLEATYAESVPRVRMIADNHGYTFTHDIN